MHVRQSPRGTAAARRWAARLALGAVAALWPFTPPPRADNAAPAPALARVDAGILQGVAATGGLRIYRGIPFAAPPLGEKRWQAPQPVAPWTGVRPAERFGPRCMQLPVYSDMVFRSETVSEDCLYLNVWTPATTPGRRLAVLLYFNGGGFIAGDASELRYDGASLARRGIVVVTANYRLSVFGFLAHPELTQESPHHASGAWGFLDQVEALRWVHRNIEAFGGDPRRITIGGESAGSASASILMASPLSAPLIAGAIGESGALMGTTFPPVSLAQAESSGVAFARRAGASTLAALRALPADSLLRATDHDDLRFPRLAVDGYLLPAAPEVIFAAGRQARVPLLLGWNSQESDWHGLLGDQEPTPEHYAAALQRQFGASADEALRVFPGRTPAEVMESASLLAGANFIAYGTWKWAELHGRTGRHRVYRYLYARARPAMRPPGRQPAASGAVHSAEIEYLLGNLATNVVYAWTSEDSALSEVMQRYVVGFVRSGDPNGDGLPPWPPAGSGESRQVMVLDVHPHAESSTVEAAFRFLDRYYTSPGRQRGIAR